MHGFEIAGICLEKYCDLETQIRGHSWSLEFKKIRRHLESGRNSQTTKAARAVFSYTVSALLFSSFNC